jgi:cytochrome oxidase Cu insertion factor (SCO1/SenC/PrrC family)
MNLNGIILAGLLGLAPIPALAADDHAGHEGHTHGAAPAANAPASTPLANPAKKRDPQAYFTDRQLIDQNGVKQRFYSDVLKGRLVVMNTIFTNCADACPLITEQMTRVRAALGDSFGKDVYFVSISSDPERDSPQAMKKFAQKHKADVPGWVWLTGRKDDIEHILKKLGQWSKDVESHSTQLIAWNFNTDKGRKMMPNVAPEMIAAQIKLLASDDGLPLPALGNVPKAN